MKQTKLYILIIGLLLGAMLLTACSSDALPGEQEGDGAEVIRTDSCYINLRIVGNSQAITRATFSDQATAAENAVYDGILCIFEGEDEEHAILKTAVVIDQLINNPGTAGAQSLDITQRLAIGTHNYKTGEYLYVLALLNTSSTGFSIGGMNKNELLFKGSSQKGNNISQIQQLQINSVGSTDKHVGLFMSNAPQDNGSGGISIMPEATALYDTEASARALGASRVTINVERAAAKVKVTDNTNSSLTNIRLNPRSSDSGVRNPIVHKMTWSLNKYNTKSYAIRKGYTAANNWGEDFNYSSAPENIYTAKVFSLYPQQSFSGDDIYIGENTTNDGSASDANVTEVVVEVQLKDESNMLMHECFVFHPYQDYYLENAYHDIYTSPEQYIAYLRDELPPENKGWFGLGEVENAEIFKYATVEIGNDNKVVFTLVNSDLTETQQGKLSELATFLSNHTAGFRDGKMYYTYKIKHDNEHTYGVVRNNAYNMKLQNSSITAIGRPTP